MEEIGKGVLGASDVDGWIVGRRFPSMIFMQAERIQQSGCKFQGGVCPAGEDNMLRGETEVSRVGESGSVKVKVESSCWDGCLCEV